MKLQRHDALTLKRSPDLHEFGITRKYTSPKCCHFGYRIETASRRCGAKTAMTTRKSKCCTGFRFLALWTLALCSTSGQRTMAQNESEHVVERSYTTELTYRCLVTLPAEYESAPDRKWPMILFLHGGGLPKVDKLKGMTASFRSLPAIVVAPLCPPSPDGPRFVNWHWKILGEVVREISSKYRVDPKMRSVVGFSMGGSGAWELPSFEPKLFTKSVVIAGVCHPWSLRHYPKTQVWVFSGTEDYMRKEQHETVTSAKRFGVDVVETTWKGADHGGIFKNASKYQRMLDWLVTDMDLRVADVISK